MDPLAGSRPFRKLLQRSTASPVADDRQFAPEPTSCARRYRIDENVEAFVRLRHRADADNAQGIGWHRERAASLDERVLFEFEIHIRRHVRALARRVKPLQNIARGVGDRARPPALAAKLPPEPPP